VKRRTLLGAFVGLAAFAVIPTPKEEPKYPTWKWVRLGNGLEAFVTSSKSRVDITWTVEGVVSALGMSTTAGFLTMKSGNSLTVRRV